MTTLADLEQVAAPGADPTVDRVAAAALGVFAEFGIRRATIDDVAARAGVSKMTVFRRFGSKQGLVAAVIARELRRGVDELDRAWDAEETLEQRVVHGFTFALGFVRDHPVFDRLLRSEPDVLLPLLTTDGSAALALYRELLAERLREEVRAGRAAPADVDQAAEVLARLAISLILTRQGTITLDDDVTIVALVRNVLLPMLLP